MNSSQFDLTNSSFDEFVGFLFDHAPPPRGVRYDPWYWHVEAEFDPVRICNYYMELFQNPQFLLSRFTKGQLEEGFWAIQVPNLDCSVFQLIENEDLPLEQKVECIHSMASLFRNLFASEPLDSSVHMWWDSLCYDWHCANRRREGGGQDLALQDAFFETLSEVLAIESSICQMAALHGLGHLHHPLTVELIDRFIEQHPNLGEEDKKYALKAAKFEVL